MDWVNLFTACTQTALTSKQFREGTQWTFLLVALIVFIVFAANTMHYNRRLERAARHIAHALHKHERGENMSLAAAAATLNRSRQLVASQSVYQGSTDPILRPQSSFRNRSDGNTFTITPAEAVAAATVPEAAAPAAPAADAADDGRIKDVAGQGENPQIKSVTFTRRQARRKRCI